MNCAECQTEPLTPEHFCPCCGRKLSLQERRVKEPAAPVARCLSCGGMSTDGKLCKSCQHALAPVMGNARPAATAANELPAAGAQKPPTMIRTKATVPAPAVTAPASTPQVKASTPQNVAETFKIDALTTDSARAVADLTAKAHLAKAANPPPVVRRPIVPPAPQLRRRSPMWLAAGAVIVVAIAAVVGAQRLGFQWPVASVGEKQLVEQTPTQEGAMTAEGSAMPSIPDSAANVPLPARESGGPAQVAARRKPRTPAQQAAGVRQTSGPDERVAPVVASTPVEETPAPVSSPASRAMSAQHASDPPAGRFFERQDVDEPPQVETRVEPQLPANLSARAQNDVVVVRVLVSRTGRAFRINLLRGSKLGRSADEAVVAAVTQWTFSPAKKRGEPVNCWFNIGVPLGRAR